MKAVTIKDVAREARVSVASASRALNNYIHVTPDVRERVLRAAERLRYTPHNGARSLITRRTNMIGVLLPDIHSEFFSEIIRGIDLAARARKLHLFVSSTHGDAEEAGDVLRAMRGRVDGLLIMSPHVDGRFVQENLAGAAPFVLMNTAVGGGDFAALNVDNYAGAYAMVRHLIESGRRRIAHIAGPRGNFDSDERLRGYRAALRALPGASGLVLRGDFSEQSGRVAGDKLAIAEPRPDAVFAANDMMAIGCLAALNAAGLQAPRDIAIAGFDDIPIASYVRPALTTMRVQIADLGRRALDRLARAIEDSDATPKSVETIRPELVVRESCGSRQGRAGGANDNNTKARRGRERNVQDKS